MMKLLHISVLYKENEIQAIALMVLRMWCKNGTNLSKYKNVSRVH